MKLVYVFFITKIENNEIIMKTIYLELEIHSWKVRFLPVALLMSVNQIRYLC